MTAEFLDDAAGGGAWNPVAVGQNARAAAQDSSAGAYIGELDSQPTRTSLPITNEAGIVQISPGAGGVDLTRPAEGYPDSPDTYRPSGDATFARVIPDDEKLAQGAAEFMAELGARLVRVEFGDSAYGRLMAEEFEQRAAEVGVQVTEKQGSQSPNEPGPHVTVLFLADPEGILTGREDGLVSAPLVAKNLPGQEFVEAFRIRYGREPGPYAAYGFEAMNLALLGIEAAGDSGEEFRPDVREAVLEAERPDSVLGNYSITPDGDSTLCSIQLYDVWRFGKEGPPKALESRCVGGDVDS